MKPLLALLALLVALPAAARADRRPDFDDDAKPILRQQPDLLHYVKQHFDVQDTGYARVPGDDDHAPPPPYIFRARPRGSSGPYTITLFIQPGPPGHILFVKGDARPGGMVPPGSSEEPPLAAEPPAPARETPTPAQPSPGSMEVPPAASTSASSPAPASNAAQPTEFQGVTSETPSGPIKSSSAGSLAPPPDPAPAH
jgi:hypothetical protein